VAVWPRRLVAVVAPCDVDAAVRALLRAGIAPSRVTLLAPGRFYGDLPRGLRVRQGARVLPRREGLALGGVAGAFAGALCVLTGGTVLAHAAVAWPASPLWSVIPPLLGSHLVATLWLYGAAVGMLLGALLGGMRGMPPSLAARFDESLLHGDVLIAVHPSRGAAPGARAALEDAGAWSIRLCYGDLRAMGYAAAVPAPEDDPGRWSG
jgi:hypothetical protein